MIIKNLRDRVASVMGINRELDALLHEQFVGEVTIFVLSGPHDGDGKPVPAYTASVDAAMALIGCAAPDWRIYGLRQFDELWAAMLWRAPDQKDGVAPTPALALISALLAAVEAGQAVPSVGEGFMPTELNPQTGPQ